MSPKHLRERLASNAPPVPEWFKEDGRGEPNYLKMWDVVVRLLGEEIPDWQDRLESTRPAYPGGPEFDANSIECFARGQGSELLLAAIGELVRACMRHRVWLSEQSKRRISQWPWAYADMVIASQNRGTEE